jgi:anti-sigma regulatory factor (Ser/Thr protein kinase)/putative methionine-R-sulfoxide reductase with GAF domain
VHLDDPQTAQEPLPRAGEGQIFLGTAGAPPLGQGAEQLLHVYRLNELELSDLGLDELLDELLDRTREILNADTVAILLLDDERHELVARAAKGLEEEVRRGVRVPLGGGFAGRIAAERTPIYIAEVARADIVNPILREKGLRSMLGVPLIVEGRAIGVLHVGTLAHREFTNEDAALLQLVAARAAPAIERARVAEAFEREHLGAVALQRSLLPEGTPTIAGVEIATQYLPARDLVGGDWYDVIELPRGRVGIAIGDVAGHGVQAAALMGQLRTGLRAYALEGHAPGETLKRVDRLMHTIRGQGMATAAYAVVEPESGALRYASAGHLPPLLVTVAGGARLLDVQPAPPLGTLPYGMYVDVETELQPGDTIVLYTDGLIERRTEAITAGLERLREAADISTSAFVLCQHLVERLVEEGAGQDDVAIVALRSLPLGPKMRVRLPASPNVLAHVRRLLRRWLHAHGATPAEVASLTLAAGEACANAVEHAYAPRPATFELEASHSDGLVTVIVRDGGRWREPRGEHRGRGLSMIAAVVDEVDVRTSDAGTEVVMRKRLGA